jgi:CheY-like chemotaxis protein
MGGTMWVESESNKGSTFHFTILAQAIAAQPLRQHDFYALQGKRVLVVDDTEVNRMILVHLTKRWGMTPVAVASGPDALAELNGGSTFDLAILDMQMPEMNGMALVGAVRKRTEAKALPLVLLTSLGKPRHGEDGQPSELAAVLNKPVKPSQLLDTLLRIFDRQSALPKMLDSAPVKSQFDQIRGDLPALRILLAEDNIVNQKVATRILQRLGYRADIAANGFEVLTALERQPYDVVFMDVHMPELDGLETTLRIRQHPNLSNQPYIIAMTADVVLGYRELCIEAGMNDYVSKPVRLEELVAALRRVQVSG